MKAVLMVVLGIAIALAMFGGCESDYEKARRQHDRAVNARDRMWNKPLRSQRDLENFNYWNQQVSETGYRLRLARDPAYRRALDPPKRGKRLANGRREPIVYMTMTNWDEKHGGYKQALRRYFRYGGKAEWAVRQKAKAGRITPEVHAEIAKSVVEALKQRYPHLDMELIEKRQAEMLEMITPRSHKVAFSSKEAHDINVRMTRNGRKHEDCAYCEED